MVAKEFLEAYDHEKHAKDKYYVPLFKERHIEMLQNRWGGRIMKEHIPSSRHCDKFTIDFDNDFPSIVEYGSRSFSYVINNKLTAAYFWSINGVSKAQIKKLRNRFNFLINNKIECTPVDEEIAEYSIDLLHEFIKENSLKKSIRNSLNDLLILSCAISNELPLRTEDSLLLRFATARYGGNLRKDGAFLVADFSRRTRASKQTNFESKGYINRGWRIAFQNKAKIF